MAIEIREAVTGDIPTLLELLKQIASLHHRGRPDFFADGGSKYDRRQLAAILKDRTRPVFVAEEKESGAVLGYAFCLLMQNEGDSVLLPVRRLYLDDLCVAEQARGRGVGKLLIRQVKECARRLDCAVLDLNVWAFNRNAIGFYEANGFTPQRLYYEWKPDSED
ncbi:MAG: GNAT family N-acetyltransferase [Clostridia bacterium]|nr:GNAT family N-acetyltransferase [Clostridia bacterium]